MWRQQGTNARVFSRRRRGGRDNGADVRKYNAEALTACETVAERLYVRAQREQGSKGGRSDGILCTASAYKDRKVLQAARQSLCHEGLAPPVGPGNLQPLEPLDLPPWVEEGRKRESRLIDVRNFSRDTCTSLVMLWQFTSGVTSHYDTISR